MPTIWSFESIENNHDVYRGKDKKVKNKKMKKSYETPNICYICKEKFDNK